MNPQSHSIPSAVIKPFAALVALLFASFNALAQQPGASPVKIFVVAGQSNMLGQGNISPAATPGTLDYIVANDPEGERQFLVDGGGAWVIRDDVWITDQNNKRGGLTVGYGSNNSTIGPELGFGHFIGDLYDKQVLIVKAAWGGKSLGNDFLPPSSGSTPATAAQGEPGYYYQQILDLVDDATTNLGTYFPGYDGNGYELAGFCWHQGWNDRVNGTYSAAYETNMANFIRDIRTDLSAPNLPFVIATTGMDGGTVYTDVELAQLAMGHTSSYPEFSGNVAVIDTRGGYDGMTFWRLVEQSPVEQGYHWNRNAETYLNIGLAMGDAMSLMAPGRCPYRLRAEGGPGGVTVSWQNGTETPTSVRVLRDGAELAPAAPVSPASFLDTTAVPDEYDYELQFTMPGDPCAPLTTTFNGGITDLELSRASGHFVLTWTNNMTYDAIKVMRNATVLQASLSGAATTYTDTSPLSSGLVTYSVVPTNGSSAPATIQVDLDLRGQLGILDLTAHGGINPATGAAWKTGDAYRLAFVSSATTQATSSDISTYNAFVQGLADTAGLGDATWNVAGSTATVDARDNTGTNPNNGLGVAVFLIDGVTKLAGNNTALWSGLAAPLNRDERGNTGISGNAFTGSETNGRAVGDVGSRVLGGSNEDPPKVRTGSIGDGNKWMKIYNSPASQALRVYAISDPLTIVSSGSSNTFSNWIGGYDVGDLTGFADDPDGDGLPNGIEGWFGTDPSVGNPGLAQAEMSGDALTFEHPVADPALTDVTGSYEWSLDLDAWYAVEDPGIGTTVDISSTTENGTAHVTATITAGDSSKLFVRAVATSTP